MLQPHAAYSILVAWHRSGTATYISTHEIHTSCIPLRQVDLATGLLSTVAGNHSNPWGALGDDGPALDASLSQPNGIAFDAAGNLFIADSFHNIVRKVRAAVY